MDKNIKQSIDARKAAYANSFEIDAGTQKKIDVLFVEMRNVVPTRAAVHQKVYDEARSIPGVGDAIDVVEKASYAGHLAKLFRKKK